MELEIRRMKDAISHLNKLLYNKLRQNVQPVCIRKRKQRRRFKVLHGICRDRSTGLKLCIARKRKKTL